MYRTCTVQVYDVLDTVYISAVILNYHTTPGLEPPTRETYSAAVRSTGEDDPTIWLWKALQGLQTELDTHH